jgi:hypothetical protein
LYQSIKITVIVCHLSPSSASSTPILSGKVF